MKLGDLITELWQHSKKPLISEGLVYKCVDGKTTICLNDLRAIWTYLNQDVPVESRIKEYRAGEQK